MARNLISVGQMKKKRMTHTSTQIGRSCVIMCVSVYLCVFAGGQNVFFYKSNHMSDQACFGSLQLKPGTKAV